MTSEVTASITQINPSIFQTDGYELADQSIIPNESIMASFVPYQDIAELWVYDSNGILLGGNPNFLDYTLVDSPSDTNNLEDGNSSEIKLDPITDALNLGFDVGVVNTIYNFIQYHLSSSQETQFYLSEISSDRTEIRLKSNEISNEDLQLAYSSFKELLISSEYFDEFYVYFGDNEYQIGVNVAIDKTESEYSILVKLYDALPPQFSLKDTLTVVTKNAESVGYAVDFPSVIDLPLDVTYLQGPNINLEIKDFVNNSTELKSNEDLFNTQSSGSKDRLKNTLNREGVTITPNYSYDTFNEFINFSSAKRRIENFVEKVEQIQAYESDIDILSTITGSTSESFQVSSSVASAYTKIENLIKNFDGYEYFLYYNTGSFSYPKTGSSFPYTLLPTTSPTVLNWLGSDVENSQYYGGIYLSASIFDNNNQNWLYYTIPEFIRDNNDNSQYLEFTNMVGQHFDEIWLYTKTVTEKLNTTSDLEGGVPLGLADDVISSLGYSGFGSNYNNQDNFIGLTGENNGIYTPPTGSELITNYIAVNGGNVVNYWVDNYSYDNYVQQLSDPGYPYAIDKVSKEIFKRLYHNMAYLTKKKGTISGLRQLINIWGIPNTILRINEFGGKNKDNTDDYDLWYNRYSYAFTPVSTQNVASASVVFPWMPLNRNFIAESEYIVPDNIQFRFKTTGYPSSSFAGEFFTQSLAVKKSDGDDTSTDFDFGIALYYEPPTVGSYSGSYSSEYENWGTMKFYISGAAADGGVAMSDGIYLPFFDKGWWSVMLQRDTHVSASDNTKATTYTLYAKNKIYNGFDGNSIGFEGSASIVSNISESINEAWNKFGTGSADGIYLGGFISGSDVGGITLNDFGRIFSGSLQEFRYYATEIDETIFNDFVMNPESIEGINITGSLSSFDVVNFRAPLGNELESIFTSSLSSSYTETMISVHPAISGAADILITGSFINPGTSDVSSEFSILYYENSTTKTYSKTNTEVYFLDQPAVGIRNRISNKIQVQDGSDYGNVLSSLTSIEQDYQISRSYTEDISNLEVAFSPQDEVNDDIIQTFGYGVLADTLADPRFMSSSDDYYPRLRKVAEDYFEKYTKGNVYDYLRLIKYFDNSIFKAIKSYVPARTSVSTGIVIKQHLLERNRAKPVQLSEVTKIAVTPSGGLNTPINLENLELTSSISIGSLEGGAGGSVNKFNTPAGWLRLQDNDVSSEYILTTGSPTLAFTHPDYSFIDTQNDTFLEVSQSIVGLGNGFPNPTDGVFTNTTDVDYKGDIQFSLFNLPSLGGGFDAAITVSIYEVGLGLVASETKNVPVSTIEYFRSFNNFVIKANTSYYIEMSTDTDTVVRRLQFGFENNPNQFWSGQVYKNYNQSALGLITDLDHREEEFYDGEYSGSELIATTQSLFDNPFTTFSPTETVYDFNVNAYSISDYGPTTIELRLWDKGTMNFNNTIEVATAGIGTGSIVWVTQSHAGIYYVAGVALFDEDGLGSNVVDSWEDQMYLGNLYPTDPYYWAYDNTWDQICYFKLNLRDAIQAGTVDPDPHSNGMTFEQVTSQGLLVANHNPLISGLGYGMEFEIPTGGFFPSTGAPEGGPGSSRWIRGSGNFILAPGTYGISSLPYWSKHQATSTGQIGSLGYTIKNSASIGESVVTTVPLTYYEDANPSYTRVYGVCFNSVDINDNNNSPTLNFNGLSYEFTLDDISTSASAVVDSGNLTLQNKTYSSLNDSYLFKYTLGTGDLNNSRMGSVSTTLVAFDPYIDPSAINFENSDYYATLNNFNQNRPNTYIMKAEYDNGIATPSNLPQIINNTAERAETPDSNYTSKHVTIPRYLGSKLQNADYNNFTPGDPTNFTIGKIAAIDKNPMYFAHFKSSKESYELWDAYTFRIDSLIEAPFEDVVGKRVEPKSLKVDGSNNRLSDVVSTFEKDRKALVAYTLSTKNGINYTSIKVGSSDIFQGGMEYNLILGTEASRTSFVTTASFETSSWFASNITDIPSSTTAPGPGSSGLGFMHTGSGYLKLTGKTIVVSGSYAPSDTVNAFTYNATGPGLGVIHSMNYFISSSTIFNDALSGFGIGAPQGITLNPEDSQNYWRFNPSSSELYAYEDFDQNFLIQRGDEIRVKWNIQSNPARKAVYKTQDFVVKNIRSSGSAGDAIGDEYVGEYCDASFCYASEGWNLSRIMNIVEVTPNPEDFNIPNGIVTQFTIRRRVQADNRVVIYQLPASGSEGVATLSGEGYLIPEDMTSIQKKNVETIINQLKAKNAFKDDTTNLAP